MFLKYNNNSTITLIRELVIEVVCAFLLLAVILFFDENNFVALLFCVVSGLVLYFVKPHKIDFISASIASVVGPLADISSVYFGSWEFANSIFIGIPPWLPVSWAVNFLLFRRLGQTLTELYNKTIIN